MTRTFTLALAFSLTACGGKDGGADTAATAGGANGGGAAAGLSAEQQWMQDYGYLSCGLVRDCLPNENSDVQYDQCIQAVDQSVSFWSSAFCSFDQAAAEECMAWLETIDCDGFDEGEPEACERMWDCGE